jgi:hypothetical protein
MPTEQKIIKIVDGVNPNIQATVDQRNSKGAVAVEIIDGSGNQVTDFGQVEATGFEGGAVTIGTTPVEITFTGTTQAIAIKAASTNTGIIYIGGASIDSSGNNATGELTADSFISIDLNDSSAPLYVCASISSQRVFKFALT